MDNRDIRDQVAQTTANDNPKVQECVGEMAIEEKNSSSQQYVEKMRVEKLYKASQNSFQPPASNLLLLKDRDSHITCEEDIADPIVAIKIRGLLAILKAPACSFPFDPFPPRLQDSMFVSNDPTGIINLTGKIAESLDQDVWRTNRQWNFDEVYDTLLECGEDMELTWRSLREQARDLEKEELLDPDGHFERIRRKTEKAAAAAAAAAGAKEKQDQEVSSKTRVKAKGPKKNASRKTNAQKKGKKAQQQDDEEQEEMEQQEENVDLEELAGNADGDDRGQPRQPERRKEPAGQERGGVTLEAGNLVSERDKEEYKAPVSSEEQRKAGAELKEKRTGSVGELENRVKEDKKAKKAKKRMASGKKGTGRKT